MSRVIKETRHVLHSCPVKGPKGINESFVTCRELETADVSEATGLFVGISADSERGIPAELAAWTSDLLGFALTKIEETDGSGVGGKLGELELFEEGIKSASEIVTDSDSERIVLADEPILLMLAEISVDELVDGADDKLLDSEVLWDAAEDRLSDKVPETL